MPKPRTRTFLVTVDPGDVELRDVTIRAALAQGFTVIGCASVTAADIDVEEVRRPSQITVTQTVDTVAPGSSVTGLRIDNL